MKKFALLVSLVISSSQFAFAQEKAPEACLDKARVAKVANTFSWTSSQDDNGKSLGTPSLCDGENPYYRAMKAWLMLEDFPLLSMQQDEFNYSVLGKSSSAFVRSRVNEFTFDRSDSMGCHLEGVAAYVVNHTPVVHLCPHLKNFSTLFLAEVFIHESRHVDGFPHQMCNRGVMRDMAVAACDSTYAEGGSYGVGAEFNIRVSRTEGIDAAVRAEARASGLDALFNRFNKMPLGLADGVYAQATNRSLLFLGDKKINVVQKEAPAGTLVNRFGNATWYDADGAEVMSADVFGKIDKALGTYAKDFRVAAPEQRKALRDVLYGYEYACQLFDTQLSCTLNKETLPFVLPGKSVGFIQFKDDTGLRLENGDLLLLPKKFDALKKSKVENWKVVKTRDNYKNFVAFNNNWGFSLEADGQLRSTDGLNVRSTPVQGLENYRFQKIIGPIIWSEKLKGL